MPRLSKSKIIAYRQCPKRLWLEVHRPELREDSASAESKFRIGNEVGEMARRLYDPEGTGVLIDAQTEGYGEAFKRSAALLAEGGRIVFEAGVSHDGTIAFADVMIPDGSGGWRMVEVKASSKVKDYQADDAAVQAFVARAMGVPVSRVAVAHVDTGWTYPGGGDYRGLLVEADLTESTLARAGEVASWLREAHEIAASDKEPDVAMGPHCDDPFECPFGGYCSTGVQGPEFPIDWLPSLHYKRKAVLAAEGIDDMSGVPDNMLNDLQRRVRDCTLGGKDFFDETGARKALEGGRFPLCFLDFETVNLAVPVWAGTRPYQQVPFQYSLQIASSPREVGERAFLDISGNDPTGALAQQLIDDCGDTGTIYAYNMTFEAGVIRMLADRHPSLAPKLLAIAKRLRDLLPVARDHYYHPSMQGSWSIKAVLPAAVPHLDYASLEGVKDGGMAMDAYKEAIHPDTSAARREEIRRQLLAYCALDTLAMVELWKVFAGRTPVSSAKTIKSP